jgi:hypothetical protein
MSSSQPPTIGRAQASIGATSEMALPLPIPESSLAPTIRRPTFAPLAYAWAPSEADGTPASSSAQGTALAYVEFFVVLPLVGLSRLWL